MRFQQQKSSSEIDQTTSIRKHKRKEGSATILICFLVAIICAFGMLFVLFGKIFGGTQELQHATDAGLLNVSKQFLKAHGQSLNAGVEANNFPDLVDSNGTITLNTYNRAVAQSLLVSLNAKEEGTDAAIGHAQELANSLHGTNDSIGQRLKNALNGSNATAFFLAIANCYRLKMLGSESEVQFQTANFKAGYLKHGGATNVYIDPSILPSGVSLPPNSLSNHTSSNGQSYITGYRDISVDGINTLQGVSVQPKSQPHLVMTKDVTAAMNLPNSSLVVPPNSFGAEATAFESVSRRMALTSAASIVGSLSSEYAASIPGGYLVVGFLDNSSSASQTLGTLMASVGGGADTSIFPQMRQRLREVKPAATDVEIDNFLNAVALSDGQTAFIFLDHATNSFTYSTCSAAPRHVVGTNPDGTIQQYNSSGYILVSTIPSAPPVGNTAYYTPSSGYNNLLGSLVVYKQAVIASTQPPGDGGGGGGPGDGGPGGDGGGGPGDGGPGGEGGTGGSGASGDSGCCGAGDSGSGSCGAGDSGSGSCGAGDF